MLRTNHPIFVTSLYISFASLQSATARTISAAIICGLLLSVTSTVFALEPANPNANEDVRKILNYMNNLRNRSENRVISAHFVRNHQENLQTGFNEDIQPLYSKTGKWIAMIGTTYEEQKKGSYRKATPLLKKWWDDGGLVSIDENLKNPMTGGGHRDMSVNTNVDTILTKGKAANKRWRHSLDRVADGLDDLQKKGVVVLWRPLREMTGGWFWWGFKTTSAKDFKRLYRDMFDYFTHTRKLNNLIWVYSPTVAGTNKESFLKRYPGEKYVDITGFSFYSRSGNPSTSDVARYKELAALPHPVAITEGVTNSGSYDYQRFPETVKKHFPKAAYALVWGNKWSLVNNKNPEGFMNHPWIITRDELDWRRTASKTGLQPPTNLRILPVKPHASPTTPPGA